jgi:ketosteroid isomerase-like protein
MKSTKDIIDHHLKAFADRDLNGVLSDYAPSAIFFTPQGLLRGTDAFRPIPVNEAPYLLYSLPDE